MQYWDDGVYLMGMKPFPLFAAWSDGRVIFRVHGQLYEGKIDPAAVNALTERFAKSGFFDSRFESGLSFPDGPSQTFCATWNGTTKQLTHDGSYGSVQIERIEPGASPSREEAQALVDMWTRCIVPLDEVAPDSLRKYRDAVDWHLPGR